MAERQGSMAGRTGQGTRTFYYDTKYKEVPGLDNFSITANEPTATTYSSFDGSFVEVGRAEVGDASWDIVSFNAHHPAWKFMESKRRSQDSVQFRVETGEVQRFEPGSGATVAIDTDGAVTFGGTGNGSKSTDLTDNSVARGLCFKIGSDLHTIESISDDDVPVFIAEAPASAVAAASYKVVYPIVRWAFSGIIKTPFEITVGRESLIASRLVVTPNQIIPLPTIQSSLTS